MKIVTYIMSFPDEVDVLDNPVLCAKKFSDEVFLFDGGPRGHLCYNPRDNLESLKDYAKRMDINYAFLLWRGNPGEQRNNCLAYFKGYYALDDYWIVQMDSDEIASERFCEWAATKLRDEETYSNFCPMMYWLHPDEEHYASGLSGALVHGRICKSGTVEWTNGWHEHQFYEGRRLVLPPGMAWFHMRILFKNRLIRQKGHGPEGWTSLRDEPQIARIPDNVIVPEIHYPEEDRV